MRVKVYPCESLDCGLISTLGDFTSEFMVSRCANTG